MNQERSKQFQSAKESLIKREPLADVVLPGTAFMARLTAQLRYLVAKKMSEDIEWRDVEVIVSGPDVPGESMHKIGEYIRLCKSQVDYDPNTKHCLYGVRDDLLLVSLATHEPHFTLVCEQDDTQNASERKKSQYLLLHLSLIRECLEKEFNSLKFSLPFKYDFERILDDFILLSLITSNDLLPRISGLQVSRGGLNILMKIYKEVLPTCDDYIQDGGQITLTRLEKIFARASTIVESKLFEEQYVEPICKSPPPYTKPFDDPQHQQVATMPTFITETETVIFNAIRNYLSDQSHSSVLRFPFAFSGEQRSFALKLVKDLDLSCLVAYSHASKVTELELSFAHNYFADEADDNHSDCNPSKSELSKQSRLNEKRQKVLQEYSNLELITDAEFNKQLEEKKKKELEPAIEKWKAAYYKEMLDIDFFASDLLEHAVASYILSIQLINSFYYQGILSWRWFYPYHYAPKLSDLKDLGRFQSFNFPADQPFTLHEYLMAVLPPCHKRLVPIPYQGLMTDYKSPISLFYPTRFYTDFNKNDLDEACIPKIPFVDEKQLLEAIQSKQGLLREHELRSNRFGEIYHFAYDKDQNRIYKNPSYNSRLPDVRPCLARETVYHLPAIIQDKPMLLPGAKLGKDSPAGFPSLDHISHDSLLTKHDIRMFKKESSKDTMVISIKNRFTDTTLQELADLLIARQLYVDYPYLKEAIVVGVSNSEYKYFIKSKEDGESHNFSKHQWTEEERETWHKKKCVIQHKYNKRLGLLIGDTEFMIHFCLLNGMHRNDEGVIAKRYRHPSNASVTPLQTIVIKVSNPDDRFTCKQAPSQEIEAKANRAWCTLNDNITTHNILNSNTITTHSIPNNNKVDHHNTTWGPLNNDHDHTTRHSSNDSGNNYIWGPLNNDHSSTNTTHSIPNNNQDDNSNTTWGPLNNDHDNTTQRFPNDSDNEQELKYLPARDVANDCKISVLTLSKITSSLLVMESNGNKLNVGLSLKFEHRKEKVIGYTRKNSTTGYWEYSDRAIGLIHEFIAAFPEFVDLLNTRKENTIPHTEEFMWTTEQNDYLYKMRDWLNNREIHSLRRATI
ncbi:hypothetical protein G6F16_010443 [Rhizopus arrhizus]|uniref:Uncharacterized protein n=1 Tax=Rhizopus oryzae TaxID=64495 RepID=A0A9P6X784_RHIOR|nr:hypothetical protein G6F23_006764 [Rhizopus arrhizus]KAG0763618.1 hypothetical protein G6F24_005875 [Rhizopus arrhizus]KAG0791795.1 hypothetical protein G6F21_004819 [Rhizopus arrhizus]KAG0791864.1 hypothetical protein G6F22_006020 [Rhizopus arrhizus]KAG0807013.1 hypothetical protein G6F20_010677 [Rhizopus arrhizus]